MKKEAETVDLIKIAIGDYPRYEELLLRKDKLEKEAFFWYEEYIRVFGKYLVDVFEAKVECVRVKKLIALAQAEVNRGLTPDMNEISSRVREQMLSYYNELESLIKEHEDSKKAQRISAHEAVAIKKLYREIAKLIHPDLNPEPAKDEALQDLWNRVVIAYKCNHLVELEELRVLVNKVLEDKGIDVSKAVIPNIQEKILELEEKINEIITTDPYNYKFLLEDNEETEQRIKDLEDEKNVYIKYREELDETLRMLTGE